MSFSAGVQLSKTLRPSTFSAKCTTLLKELQFTSGPDPRRFDLLLGVRVYWVCEHMIRNDSMGPVGTLMGVGVVIDPRPQMTNECAVIANHVGDGLYFALRKSRGIRDPFEGIDCAGCAEYLMDQAVALCARTKVVSESKGGR